MAGMSKDRIKFKVLQKVAYFSSVRAEAIVTALVKGLGMYEHEARHCVANGATIICRPSQFARFLIFRNEAGGDNTFKELEPELFTPDSIPRVLDVSMRAANN